MNYRRTLTGRECLVIKAVQSVLSEDLRRKPWRGHHNPLAGHCYAASESLFHLLGGKKAGYKPMCCGVTTHYQLGQGTHWFLVHGERVIDPTKSQLGKQGESVYYFAKGKGFLTKRPSARAREIIRRARRLL